MLCFIVTGRIGRIETLGDGSLRIAIGYERESAGKEWVCRECRDQALAARLVTALEVGAVAKLEGMIEPRRLVRRTALSATKQKVCAALIGELSADAPGRLFVGNAPQRIPKFVSI